MDAVAVTGAGDLVLSFDTTVMLGEVTADDEDLVALDATGVASLLWDGSAAGVNSALDLDGAHIIASNGHLLVSFDGSGSVGGVFFDDEDVLEHDPVGGTWELVQDSSGRFASWGRADLDALSARATGAGDDADQDGVPDALDNCIEVPNGPLAGPNNQLDSNADGYGNICDPDLNDDGSVDFLDLGLLKAVFFSGDADADLNGDGSVDFLDLGLMKAGFFQAPGPSGLACAGTVPCP